MEKKLGCHQMPESFSLSGLSMSSVCARWCIGGNG